MSIRENILEKENGLQGLALQDSLNNKIEWIFTVWEKDKKFQFGVSRLAELSGGLFFIGQTDADGEYFERVTVSYLNDAFEYVFKYPYTESDYVLGLQSAVRKAINLRDGSGE